MPINITCSECQYAFAVADEYAGQAGRCPECGAVLRVPGRANPYGDTFADDGFDAPRPRRREPEPTKPTAKEPAPRTFNADARSAKWLRVAHGYRNILIAFVLIGFDELIRGSYNLVRGVEKVDPNNMDEGRLALVMGNLFISGIAMVLWSLGRMAGAAVPYVPARSLSVISSVSAALTGFSGVCGLIGIMLGVAIARNNLQLGASLMVLSAMGLFFGMICGVVAEMVGLIAQLRVASALKDRAFLRSTQLLIGVLVLVTGLGLLGCCIGMVAISVAAEKEKQKMQKEKAQDKQKDKEQPAKEDKAPNANPQVKNAEPPENAKDNPPQGPQPPPPEFNPEDHPELMAGLNIAMMVVTFSFCFVYINCMRLGRRAILREVDRLQGRENLTDEPY